jgi:drug/metabolite transporter (DMT)-like permease
MGGFDNQPENLRTDNSGSGAAESVLWTVTQQLQSLQDNLLRSLQEDVKRLESEKNRLSDEIRGLREEKDHLQQARQITEQQVLMRQLGQVLANHISTQLQSELEKLASQASLHPNNNNQQQLQKYSESNAVEDVDRNVERVLGNLDDTLTITFNSLQKELNNYQSSLSHQLSRMHGQQQQGEALLAELVNRLKYQLDTADSQDNGTTQVPISQVPISQVPISTGTSSTTQVPNPISTQTEVLPTTTEFIPEEEPVEQNLQQNPEITQNFVVSESEQDFIESTPESTAKNNQFRIPNWRLSRKEKISSEDSSQVQSQAQSQVQSPVPFPVPEAPLPRQKPSTAETQNEQTQSSHLSFWQQRTGLVLVIVSTLVSSLYNVAIKAIFFIKSPLLSSAEPLILPTVGNCLLILMLRMMVVVPIMFVLAPIMHPRVWQDFQNLLDSARGRNSTPPNPATKRALLLSVVSGVFLFFSQLLIYLAIGNIPTGTAVSLFFIYPIISGFLSWFLFKERITMFRSGCFSAITLGNLLVLVLDKGGGRGNFSLGSTTAIASGCMFALYIILTRISAAKIHPVTLTLINFATMLLMSFIGLMVVPTQWNLRFDPANLLEIILGAFLLGALTLCGYILNNIGIRKFGATRSAVVGATVPALTVIIAGLMIQESLQFLQVVGVLLVTSGAAAFSLERIKQTIKPARNNN